MILLDTNILSELMKMQPQESVSRWVDQQNIDTLFISSVTVAEITYGLQILPTGQRQKLLQTRFEQFISQAFSERILSFTTAAAQIYGEIMGYRKILGEPLNTLDGQIAAIALTHNLSVATRNIKDFRNCGLTLINPFDHASI